VALIEKNGLGPIHCVPIDVLYITPLRAFDLETLTEISLTHNILTLTGPEGKMNTPKILAADSKFSVRAKLGLLVTLLIGCIATFILLYFPQKLEQEALRAVEEKANSLAMMAAFSVATGLHFDDVNDVLKALDAVRQNPDFVYVAVHDEQGRSFAAIGKHGDGVMDDPSSYPGLRVEKNLLRTDVPILVSGSEIGRLYLGLSLKQVRNQVAESRSSILYLTLGIFVTGLGAVIAISKVIVGPLSEMAHTAEAISNGDLSSRVAIGSHDELGILARAFNVMLGHIEDRTSSLEREITDRRQAEEALQDSENRLVFILAASPAIIYTYRLDGKGTADPTFVSRNIEKVLGYDPDEFLHNPTWWMSRIHPEDLAQTQSTNSRLMEDGYVALEYRFKHTDGSYRWIQDNVKLAYDGTGQPLELVGSWVDVTDRKELEITAQAAEG
jgi:PAS domain S-box-containing protein